MKTKVKEVSTQEESKIQGQDVATAPEALTAAKAETVQVDVNQLNLLIKDRENLMQNLSLADSTLALIDYKLNSSLVFKKGTKLNLWQIISGAREIIHIIEEIVKIIKSFRDKMNAIKEGPKEDTQA